MGRQFAVSRSHGDAGSRKNLTHSSSSVLIHDSNIDDIKQSFLAREHPSSKFWATIQSFDIEAKQGVENDTADISTGFLANLPEKEVREGEYELKLLMAHSR
jgi:hypothetical protein